MRHFRVTSEELSDEQALLAMMHAARIMAETALAERRTLLGLGFADNHSLCRKLDKVAGEYARLLHQVRRQLVRPTA